LRWFSPSPFAAGFTYFFFLFSSHNENCNRVGLCTHFISFIETNTFQFNLILGFVKDEIAVSFNESRTKIKINGDKGDAYLIETEISQRVRISHEVSTQGFSEDFLIPSGVDLDQIDVGFEEEKALLVITLPKVVRQEQEIALEIGKEIQLDVQETDIYEEKELEVDYDNLDPELVEREIKTIEEITDELEITTDREILQIDKEEPNLELKIKDEDPKIESEISFEYPETISDIKLEDPKPGFESTHEEPKTELDIRLEDPEPEIKQEDQKSEFEIIRVSPEIELENNLEIPEPDIEITKDSLELESEMNQETKSEGESEEMERGSIENGTDEEVEIRQKPEELEPETTVVPQEGETETTAKEKEEGIVEDPPKQQKTETEIKANEMEEEIIEDAPPEYPTPDPDLNLPKPIEKSESEEDEQQDRVSPKITSLPSEPDPDTPKSIEKNEPDHSKEQVQEEPCIASPPSGPEPDSTRSIEKNEPDQNEQVQENQPIVHPPSEFEPDSPKSIQRNESSTEEKQVGSDQESEVSSENTEEGQEVNRTEKRRRRGVNKSTLYPSVIAGSVFILSVMALFIHVLRNKRRTSR
jgi:hypothetical protein